MINFIRKLLGRPKKHTFRVPLTDEEVLVYTRFGPEPGQVRTTCFKEGEGLWLYMEKDEHGNLDLTVEALRFLARLDEEE